MAEPGPIDTRSLEAELAQLEAQRDELKSRLAAVLKELRSLKASAPEAMSKAIRLTAAQAQNQQSLQAVERTLQEKRRYLAEQKRAEQKQALDAAMTEYQARLDEVSRQVAALDAGLAALRLAGQRIAHLGEARAYQEMNAVIDRWLRKGG
jgi:chromosome segregation ATPase